MRLLVVHTNRRFARQFFGAGEEIQVASWEPDADLPLTPALAAGEAPPPTVEDWRPQVVWVFWPEYWATPRWVFAGDWPVVGAVSDWNLAARALWGVRDLYDWVLADSAGAELFRRWGFAWVDHAPLYSFSEHLVGTLDRWHQRPIDVGFVGNLNAEVQRDRGRWLLRLAKLHRQGLRIRIEGGLYGADYADFLQSCRLAFNRSIRGEMNLRCYEAPAAGCALLLEAGNREVAIHLKADAEYLPYREDDFEQRVQQALANPEQTLAVAALGQRRILHEDSYGQHWQALVPRVAGLPRRRPPLTTEGRFALWQQVLWAVNGGRGELAAHWLQQWQESAMPVAPFATTAACTVVAQATESRPLWAVPAGVWGRCRELLRLALASDAAYLPAWLALVQVAERLGQAGEAVTWATRALQAVPRAQSLEAFAGPEPWPVFDEFRTLVEGAWAAGNVETLRRVYAARFWLARGQGLRRLGQLQEAIAAFLAAAALAPEWARAQMAAGQALLEGGSAAAAAALLEPAWRQNPGLVTAWAALAREAEAKGAAALARAIEEAVAPLLGVSETLWRGWGTVRGRAPEPPPALAFRHEVRV